MQINYKGVEIEIHPKWSLEGLEDPIGCVNDEKELPDSDTLSETDRLPITITGDVTELIDTDDDGENDTGIYQIGIMCTQENITVERIGIWLPPGFKFVEFSSNLESAAAQGKAYYCVPVTSSHNGGEKVLWDYSSPVGMQEFPSAGGKKVITFQFTHQSGLIEIPRGAIPWVKVAWETQGDYLAWDVECKIHKIISTATDEPTGKYTIVEAYTPKNDFPKYGTSSEGDYEAIGCTLMRDEEGTSPHRERLYKETSGSIGAGDIPADGVIQELQLYWSGWKDYPQLDWETTGMTPEQIQQDFQAEILALATDTKFNEIEFRVDLDDNSVTIGEITVDPPELTFSITADEIWVLPNEETEEGTGRDWSYSCICYPINALKEALAQWYGGGYTYEDVIFTGWGMYTVCHAHWSADTGKYDLYEWKDNHSGEEVIAHTDYPLGGDLHIKPLCEDGEDNWAYAAWSIVVIYTSPATSHHQLYIDNTFRYTAERETQIFTVAGFLAPQDVITDPNAARVTCFVGEGDDPYEGDKLSFNGVYLSDDINDEDNVWNSKSNVMEGVTIDGMDIDTFSVQYPTIRPGDTEAEVQLPTVSDSWNFIYIILSFRSEPTCGGTMTYNHTVG